MLQNSLKGENAGMREREKRREGRKGKMRGERKSASKRKGLCVYERGVIAKKSDKENKRERERERQTERRCTRAPIMNHLETDLSEEFVVGIVI